MVTTRYRFRVGRLDGVLPDGSNWNQPVLLGHFRDKETGVDNGIPWEKWGNPHSPQSYIPELSVFNVETTWDENHGRPKGRNLARDKRGKNFYDVGGPFLNIKIETGSPVSGTVLGGSYTNLTGTKKYEGSFMPPSSTYWGTGWAQGPLNYTGNSNALLPDVAPYFDRAWQKAKPKLETASLYVALREAHEIPQMLRTTAKAFSLEYQKTKLERIYHGSDGFSSIERLGPQLSAKKMTPNWAAEQFLNQQFGWAPFLKDLGQFYQTWVNADDTIKRITMENNQWVRRKVRVDKSVDTQIIEEVQLPLNSISYALPCFPVSFPADFFLSPPSWKIVEETTLTINAVGKFRFYRPEFDMTLPDYTSAWNQVMRYIKIYGLNINPYHIWQATPWTWLLDWVSNIGSYIERLSDSAFDSVAAAYFYITAHKKVSRRMEIRLPFVDGFKTLEFERSYTSKQRVSADSPYGFNLTWENLDPRKLAILGALGITRRRGNFRMGD